MKGDFTGGAKDRAAASTYAGVMDFEESFSVKLSGSAAIVQSSLEEHIECSGNRVVVKPTANSTDVFQVCGRQSGRRTISGEVVATDEATAFAWMRQQKQLPLSGEFTAENSAQADLPPRVTVVLVWEPMLTGVFRSSAPSENNASLVRVRFTFTRLFERLELVGV